MPQLIFNLRKPRRYLFPRLFYIASLISFLFSIMKYIIWINKFHFILLFVRGQFDCSVISRKCFIQSNLIPKFQKYFSCRYCIIFSSKRVYVWRFAFHIKPHVPLAHENNKFDQRRMKTTRIFIFVGWMFVSLLFLAHRPVCETLSPKKGIKYYEFCFIEHFYAWYAINFVNRIKLTTIASSQRLRGKMFFSFVCRLSNYNCLTLSYQK